MKVCSLYFNDTGHHLIWLMCWGMLKLRRAGVVFVLVDEETSNTKLYFGHGNSRFDSTNTILIKGKLYIYM